MSAATAGTDGRGEVDDGRVNATPTTATATTVADPFGTAEPRRRVLDAWAASPARFREDANAEEDAARGAYRDRLVVELVQNALDAAAAAGRPARVLIELTGQTTDGAGPGGSGAGLLRVANTGEPISAAGVESASTLRASAKRGTDAVGRFGVGFAAVLAVSDTPAIISRVPGTTDTGGETVGVSWSRERTIEAVRALGVDGLTGELDARAGAVPVLRLPFPADPAIAGPPDGYDTVVHLPLRDAAAVATARELLRAVDPTLPLVMPGLSEIAIHVGGDGETRVLTCDWAEPPAPGPIPPPHGSTVIDARLGGGSLTNAAWWRGCVRRGEIPAELLADRPVEERARRAFAARALVPDGGWPAGVERLVRAPQPTDEGLSLPVLLSVDLPLEPSRRHTVPGPLRDWLVDRLAETVADLAVVLANPAVAADSGLTAPDVPGDGVPGAGRWADPTAALALVPSGLPASQVDARLADALGGLLPAAPVLPGGRPGSECAVVDLGTASEPVTGLLLAAAREAAPDAAAPDAAAPDAAAPDAAAPDSAVLDGAALDRPVSDRTVPDSAVSDRALPGLATPLPAAYTARRHRAALARLGVRFLDTAAVVELLGGLEREPSWWAELYSALGTVPDRDALGALPVPLAVLGADGPTETADTTDTADTTATAEPAEPALGTRLVTGPRGALLPDADLDVLALVRAGLPVRVVHPDACRGAARDVLRTLGAVEAGPLTVLRDPAVRAAALDAGADQPSADWAGGPDPEAMAAAILALVRDAGLSADDRADAQGGEDAEGSLAWLAELPLPSAGGGLLPAEELVIRDGPLDRVLADDAPFGVLADDVAAAWPAEVLEAVGVQRTFSVLRASEVGLDEDEPVLFDLDDSDSWVAELAERAAPDPDGLPVHRMLTRFVAIRDLEFVAPDRWPEALAELARPPLRAVVLDETEPSYTRWWLARHALLPAAREAAGEDRPEGEDGEDRNATALPPSELSLPGADPLLAGLFTPAAPLPGVDAQFARRIGARLTLDDVLADPDAVADLLDRLGDDERDIDWTAARAIYLAAARALTGRGETIDPPLAVRTPAGVLDQADAVVLDAPDLAPLLGDGRAALRLPLDDAAEAARVLGLPLASELADYPVVSGPDDGAEELLAPGGVPYWRHSRLLVADADGTALAVGYRVVGGIGGDVHVDAAAGTDALARALAWREGVWERRHAIAEALRDPGGAERREAEADLDAL